MKAPPPEIVFHINLADVSGWRRNRRLGFFTRVAEICESHALPFSVIRRDPGLTQPNHPAPDGRLHLVEDGHCQGEGWLNAAVAYLLGFRHLDPHGVLADSSARTARIAPDAVEADKAAAYLKSLRQRFIKPRLSRYNQPRTRSADLAPGAIAVLL